MDTATLLKKVRKIEIKTKGLTRHIFSGEYHSAFKGRGMSFSEVRAYSYGDDVRNIDWNVTARTNTPFVKVFEEERELTLMLLVDVSASTFFGTDTALKTHYMTEIAAVLAFSATQNHDKVGAIFFSEGIEKYIPPKQGKSHILLIIRELLNIEPKKKKTDLNKALEYLNQVTKKRTICFLLSDFAAADYQKNLNIAAKRHDLIGIHIADNAEITPPSVGLLKIADPETGEQFLYDFSDADTRKQYESIHKAYFEAFKTAFKQAAADTISLKTGDDYTKALVHFFESRI